MSIAKIRKKFLVHAGPLFEVIAAENPPREVIRQGYLSDQGPFIGACTTRDESGEHLGFLTLKSEMTISIEADLMEELLTMCQTGVMEKTRHSILNVAHTWEVDVFQGKLSGLVVAELELASEDEEFDMPAWADLEVTEDARYSNTNLIMTMTVPARQL